MTVGDAEIRRRLHLGEDAGWEFMPVAFDGDRPSASQRDDLADEMIAFANADGGRILCGVADDGRIPGMSRDRMRALGLQLVEAATETVRPALHIGVHNRALDGKEIVLVEVPRGVGLHERAGRAFVRVGATRKALTGHERALLARGRGRPLPFDGRAVPRTGIETLNERLWRRLVPADRSADVLRALVNLRLMARDEVGVARTTVAGILSCADKPQQWLPGAAIMATRYRGEDRASERLDAWEIVGPLSRQIGDAMKFVVRNTRVAARKTPARENLPQYDMAAIFEAVVNAVAHRDYSMASRRIRLSMFGDRIEIESPGLLHGGRNVESMRVSRSARSEVVASILGRTPVDDIPGSEHRLSLVEQRGSGVSIIFGKTLKTVGVPPEYRLDDDRLVLTVPAMNLVPPSVPATHWSFAGG